MPVCGKDLAMKHYKHLSAHERGVINHMLNEQESFKAIARALGRDPSTISKEIRRHLRFEQKGAYGSPFNDCKTRKECLIIGLCGRKKCTMDSCKNCKHGCTPHCPDYEKEICPDLLRPPYVCNGCRKRKKCTLEKRFYRPAFAQNEYKELLSELRRGPCISEKEAAALDELISKQIINGQSVHHVCSSIPDEIMYSEKSIYNYINMGILSARNIDLPRKVKFRERRKSNHDNIKIDKKCRIGRTFDNFLDHLDSRPGCLYAEADSVIGSIGGKALLTLHFPQAEFMFAFLRDRNTAASVKEVFIKIRKAIGERDTHRLFQLILADNGSEFSDPSSIEMITGGRMFYCDPSAPYQRGAGENNHTFIRRILPKGTSFDELSQKDIDLVMSHINSYKRLSLGDRSPYEMFRDLYDPNEVVLKKLGVRCIPTHDVILTPQLLK